MSILNKRIIICGPGGSGKDFLRKKLEKKGYKYSVSCTSRPKRTNEVEGVDYYFKDKDFFENNKDLFIEVNVFNGWYYGTLCDEFDKSDLFILTPKGINQLPNVILNRSFIIYLNPDENIRMERMSERKDADTAERRIKTDNEDFADFDIFDVQIKNLDF